MKVAVAQIGARRHYAVPAAFERAGLLAGFYTDLCTNGAAWRALAKWVPRPLIVRPLRRLLDRTAPEIPSARVHNCALRSGWRALVDHARPTVDLMHHYARNNASFGRWWARRGLGEADTLYVFNGAGLELMQYAKARGWRTVLDQTMAPLRVVEQLLQEERDRWAGWDDEPRAGDGWRLLAEREENEWRIADRIVCGSSYVAQSVAAAHGPGDRCRVVPYGTPAVTAGAARSGITGRPLRVLFPGTVGLRKGIGYLMEAIKLLGGSAVEARAVGPIAVTAHARSQLSAVMELTGPVPRSAMAAQYRWADVMVLPSLAEGSANVCYEAMAEGLPVITTPNAGSVVRDGLDGYLVPIRSAEALAQAMARLTDGDLLRVMSASAARRVTQFTWAAYARNLVRAVVEPAGSPPDNVMMDASDIVTEGLTSA